MRTERSNDPRYIYIYGGERSPVRGRGAIPVREPGPPPSSVPGRAVNGRNVTLLRIFAAPMRATLASPARANVGGVYAFRSSRWCRRLHLEKPLCISVD